MSAWTALLIAVLQGVTELFPVSSLGHAVILPALLGLGVDQDSPSFLPFLVVLHLGTALALLLYFWRDWVGILLGLFDQGRRRDSVRLLVLIIVATIPAVIIGLALEKPLRHLFATPLIAAAFLLANGFLLFAGERLRRGRRTASHSAAGELDEIGRVGIKGALAIGFWQCLAFLPGISRSGATLVGGLLGGLSHRASAHFSFLIATPVILGAAILEIPKMLHQSNARESVAISLIGFVAAGLAAFISIAVLMRYFRKSEVEALMPFAWYCWVAGAGALIFFIVR
jgi:undecaprenyl-diphosphatase